MSISYTEPSAIDLHTHSTASDGMLLPAELVARAASRGVRVLALTDHDTTIGLAAARIAADSHGLRLIAGIELSAAHEGRPLHIVGLDIDPSSQALHQAMDRLATLRAERAMRIGAKLAKLGVGGAYEGACAEAGSPAQAPS
jgi:3',5'-nucleoside bisphosphate phosphatase